MPVPVVPPGERPENRLFRRTGPTGLLLDEPGFADRAGIRIHLGVPAVAIDRRRRHVTTATGSRPLVPPVPEADVTGCFS
ncbi:hypothetical protein [Streptomyces sp. 11x1]|uniref:hypothetical protein n=1 Tax=Streptomyces sp. 11x1 TaxID=3038642 RepID=UPI00292FE9EB|nr:hypothetical protein [Streptomyces sp. 11x1]WNZ14220.1 hypothetical protein P8T65_46145 [Streptomyces sp. 11x1]